MDFLIGCDPELFIKHIDGHFLSAHDMIPGTKDHPYPVKGGAIQVDGVAAEFNIDPAESLTEFMGNIDAVLDELHFRIEGSALAECLIAYEPTAVFDKKYFDSLPDHVKELGCMPDFNAYTGKENIPPHTTEPFRTGGGHIHVGWGKYLDPNDEGHLAHCIAATKQLDAVLFPASLTWDGDTHRRKLYGNKGAFRPKPYGMEYRPLSNAWLRKDETIIFVYEQTVRAMDLLFNKGVVLYD